MMDGGDDDDGEDDDGEDGDCPSEKSSVHQGSCRVDSIVPSYIDQRDYAGDERSVDRSMHPSIRASSNLPDSP
jgi:hypothetical protein